MNKQNKILLGLVVVLAAANVIVYFAGGLSGTTSYDPKMFSIADTALVDKISISGPDQSIVITRSPNGWGLNDQYAVDEGLRRLFFSILQRVRVRKPVNELPADSLGLKVSLSGGVNRSFVVYSNPTKTRTFFYDPATKKGYEVEIPGYHEYLGSIFELSASQWRDRLIMDENWRTIKSLHLNYTRNDAEDVQIIFDQDFFKVPGINTLDTTKLVDYLNQFQVFEVNEIIDASRFPVYDSLSHTSPLAILEINSIKKGEPHELLIFPALGKEPFQLATDRSGQLMVINSKRLDQILLEQADFQLKD